MKRIRAVLTGIAALAALGVFYTFAFCIVDTVSDAEISEEYRYEAELTDGAAPVSANKASDPEKESPDTPTSAQAESIARDIDVALRYNAGPVDPSELDILNVRSMVSAPVQKIAAIPEMPETEAEPESFIPISYNTYDYGEDEDRTSGEKDTKAQAQPKAAAEEKADETAEQSEEQWDEDMPREIKADPVRIIEPEMVPYTPEQQAIKDSLYISDTPVYGGPVEANYVYYNFNTPSVLPAPAPQPKEEEKVNYIDPEMTVVKGGTEEKSEGTDSEGQTAEEQGSQEETASEQAQEETASEQAQEETKQAGYLVEGPYNGVEVFTANFGGEKQEIDAYSLVCMIVSTEMSPSFSEEALKAQAVAAYSYVKYHNVNGLTPSVLVKYNVPAEVQAAVDQVFGQCVYYNGAVAQTLYTASTAGTTASSVNVWGGKGADYLTSVETSIDELYDPNWGLKATYSESEMKRYLEGYFGITLSDDPNNWINITSHYDGKYVGNISIDGQAETTGQKLRDNVLHYGIKSWAFDLQYIPAGTPTVQKGEDGEDVYDVADEGQFIFTTYGYGHGVGLSQNGANILGRMGYDYKQILEYYFPGVTVE